MRKKYLTNLMAVLLLFAALSTTFAAEAPYIGPIADQTAILGQWFTFDVDAENADPPEIYSLVNAPQGMSIDATSGVISWFPNASSQGGIVTVKARNAIGESVRSFYIYLADQIVCDNDLISYWQLNGDLTDYQGGYHGQTTTSLKDTTAMVAGGKVFTPDTRTNSYFMSVNDNGQYDFAANEGFSISLWFYSKGNYESFGEPNNQVFMARGTVAENTFFWLTGVAPGYSNKVFWQIKPKNIPAANYTTLWSNSSVINNQWNHLVVTYDGIGKVIALYLNGSKTTQSFNYGSAGFEGDGDDQLDIGYWSAHPSNLYPLNGAMDDIFVYGKAMTNAEVNEAYQDGLNGRMHCKPQDYFPIIKSVPIDTVSEENLYSYTFEAGDYKNDPLTLNDENIPDFLSFNASTGVLSGTPQDSDVGNHAIRLSASDGITTVYQDFTLQVINVNDAPVVSSTPITSILEGSIYVYTVLATDPDQDPLSYEATTIPAWLSFDPVSHTLSGQPAREDVGDHQVSITISDGQLSVVHEFTITVTSDNHPPQVTSTPATTIDNYSEYTYVMAGYDQDGDALTYGAKVLPSWLTFDPETQTLSGTPAAANAGQNPVSLYVSDGYVETLQDFSITVNAVNTAPEVLSTPVDSAMRGSLYTYLLTAVDHQNDPITYIPAVIPSWLTFDVGSKVLSGTPGLDDVGVHTVMITLSDGQISVNHQFILTVHNWPNGIEKGESVLSRVYPNPAKDFIFAEFTGNPEKVELSDIAGKLVFQKSLNPGEGRIRLDVSDLQSGVYFLRVHENGQYATRKLIIE